MPISGGKYVAPTWVNSTTPPIDADELQDICDSIESYADPVAVVPTISNPNLLDNWYFAGGGSQQGGGQFPINTRGQTSYSGAAYAIDRWKGSSGYSHLSILSNSIDISTTAGWSNNDQYIKNANSLLGKTITITVLNTAGNLATKTATVPNIMPLSDTTIAQTAKTGEVYYELHASDQGVYARLATNSSSATGIVAVKLELGDTQTLAHQENGVWVLNEIPNYDIQFARCSELPSVPARYETGTYTGTGTYGSANPNSLTFGFVPKTVYIVPGFETTISQNALYMWENGSPVLMNTTTYANSSYASATYSVATLSGTTLSWYCSYSGSTFAGIAQANVSGKDYYYVAIG